MGRLTTHVLDTSSGAPAKGVGILLCRIGADGGMTDLLSTRTNEDGRCDAPLLDGPEFHTGRYCLTFRVGAYFTASGVSLPDPPFLDDVVIRFGVSDSTAHYHVPLLISPYGYSTYRGS